MSGLEEQFVERFGWGLVAEDFAGPAVERGGDDPRRDNQRPYERSLYRRVGRRTSKAYAVAQDAA
jgi:hypothetical protein